MSEKEKGQSEQSEEQSVLDEETKRAQGLVAQVWALRREYVQRNGDPPSGVVLSPEEYRLLSAYSTSLGTLNVEALEYLSRYKIFDLTIYVEPGSSCHVIP